MVVVLMMMMMVMMTTTTMMVMPVVMRMRLLMRMHHQPGAGVYTLMPYPPPHVASGTGFETNHYTPSTE